MKKSDEVDGAQQRPSKPMAIIWGTSCIAGEVGWVLWMCRDGSLASIILSLRNDNCSR
jgi:hypothetical protein